MNVVVAHRADWKNAFAEEAARIAQLRLESVLETHHIGSTAVPGLAAKPIIDIMLEVSALAAFDRESARLSSLGYEALGEFGIDGRRYFRRSNAQGTRTHHAHAFVRGSDHAARHLAFRDFLIAHTEIAVQYGALKEQLANEFPSEMNAYVNGKNAFIQTTQARALAWLSERDR